MFEISKFGCDLAKYGQKVP